MKKKLATMMMLATMSISLFGCSASADANSSDNDKPVFDANKRIVRVSHAQSETHPEHLGLLAFEEYIEDNLGDKYDVQIFPNELLGAAQKAIELTQTGAIDFVVAGTANLETFTNVYEIFSMPYLFNSVDAYKVTMEDTDYMSKIYSSTEEAGFEALTWFNAGTRNFYTTTPVRTPEDLKGLKIRVQQSPASVNMINAFGGAATPMSFGEVYTAIQQNIINGAENNELALTNNKHGEVAKYFSYDMHQMIPDMLIGNLKFLNSLPENERQIFNEAAALATQVELDEWDKQVEEAKNIAQNDMGVEFINVDINAFQKKVLPLHKTMLENNPDIRDMYEHVQNINAEFAQEEE